MKKKKMAEIIIIVILVIVLEIPLLYIGNIWGIMTVLAIAGLLILCILGLKFYDLGLVLMPFMFYLNVGGAINTSVADFIIAVWLLMTIYKERNLEFVYQSKSINDTKKYMTNYAIAFILVMLFSMINYIRWDNPLLMQGIISIVKIMVCFFYALFTLDYLDRYGRKRFLCIMAYNTLFFDLLMIVGVIAYTKGIDLGLTFAGTFRATGTFEDPNLAAAYLFLMFSFALVYFTEEKKYLLLMVTILLTLISVFLTSSKGALVAVAVGLLFVLVANVVRGKMKMTIKLLIGYIGIFAIFIYVYEHNGFVQEICEPIFNRFDEFTSNIQGDHSLAHREFLWNAAFELGMTEPILGVGVEQFRPAATQYTGQKVWNIVHNTYLTFFCELGIVGFFSFFRLWIKNAWNHFRMMKKNNSSVFYLFSIICVSVSMWSISLGNFRTLWVFMAFLLYEYFRSYYKDEYDSVKKVGKV